MENFEILRMTIANILRIDKDQIDENSSQDNIENWDSLAIVNMVTELEKVFNVQFDILEIVEFYSVEIIKLTLIDKGIKF